MLVVFDNRVRSFIDDEVSLLAAFADQASLAIEKARLLNEAEREKERSDALYRISSLLAGAHDTDEVLDLIVNEAARLVETPCVLIRLLQEDMLVPGAATARAEGIMANLSQSIEVREGSTPVGHAMATQKPVWGKAAARLLSPQAAQYLEGRGFHASSGAAIPLLANGQSIGTLTVISEADTTHVITEDDVSLLAAFADQAALALEKARLLNEAEAREQQATKLYEVTTQLASNHDLNSVLDLITQEAAELTGGKGAAIFRYDEAREGLVAATIHNMGDEFKGMFVRPGEGNAGRAYVERRAIWTNDLMADSSVVYSDENTHEMARVFSSDWGVLGVVAAPIMIQDEVYGILDVLFDKHREFTGEEINLVQNLADSAAVAINNARFIGETEQARDVATQLQEVTAQLASTTDMDGVLDLIAERAAELMGGRSCAIFRYDEDRGGLVITTMFNLNPEMKDFFIKPGEGNAGRAYQERRVVWNDDVLEEYGYSDQESERVAQAQTADWGVVGLLAAPILIQDEVYGVLDVIFDQHREFTDEEINLVQNLADSAAVAINNARFIGEIQQARDVATQLQEVTAQLASTTDMDGVLDLITVKAMELLDSRSAMIIRYDEEKGGLVIAKMYNYSEDLTELVEKLVIPPGEGSAGKAYQERRTIWFRDLSSDPGWSISDQVSDSAVKDEGMKAVISSPIIIRGEPYGALTINYRDERDFSDTDISIMETLADSAAVAINNARFIEETEQARDEATQLYEITEQLASTTDMDSILDLITGNAKELLKSDTCAIGKYDAARGGLVIPASAIVFPPSDEEKFEFLEDAVIRPGVGTSGRAYAERKPAWSQDYLLDESLTDAALRDVIVEKLGLRAGLSVPIVTRDEAYGVIAVHYYEPREFTDGEIQLLQTLADSAAVAIGNAQFIEEIQQRTAELDATNQELEAFSYSVSHDLRAPLRGIDGFSQALMNEYSDVMDEQANHYLQRVRTGSQRMGQLIDDLLALSQVTRGEMRREAVDLSKLAVSVVTDLQERDPHRKVEFIIQDGVVVNGDTRLMRVVLENLLGNAWKYTGKNQEARIEFGLTEDDGKRTCFVRDDGSGFDMAYADRLFGAFQRLHDQSEFEGSGIGLATVQRIINRHGGQIWAEAAVDEGATFYFTLREGDGHHG